MQTKYILHGGYTRKKNKKNKEFFAECFADLGNQPKILVVLFAYENDGDQEYYEKFCQRLQSFTEKDLQFEKASRENFEKQIKQADLVFLQGGDTNLTLDKMKQYTDLEKLFRGKTVAGSSAGAYALAVIGASHSETHMREGLGILPIRLVCHYKSNDLPPSQTSLEEVEEAHKDLELVLLGDCEHRVFYE